MQEKALRRQQEADKAVLLEEYRAIVAMHKHFDTMNLSMMSTITAGVFVLWGIMLGGQNISPFFLIILATVVFLVLTTWIRYMSIHRSIIVRKLARASLIEKQLGMKQNLIFQYNDDVRQHRRRPGAHATEIVVYWLLTLLGVGVMFYGCVSSRIDALSSFSQLWNAVEATWFVIPFMVFHIVFALYWGVVCRTVVAEVIPYYELPPEGITRWLLVRLGQYRDFHSELEGA
jgi:hypothetical protein